MKINDTIHFIGVNDQEIDLFESQYPVPNGMSYNSYVILDQQIAVLDTVDAAFTDEWMQNLRRETGDRAVDYLIVQHMEPDHSSGIAAFAESYPNAKIVASEKAFRMMQNFFQTDFADRRIVIGDGDRLPIGEHTLTFLSAPMVHWPEVMMTYDARDRVLFSADAFGRFGVADAEVPWKDEARRYYFGIVGKYGDQVLSVLNKLSTLEILTICPLHGSVLTGDLREYLSLYRTWASYLPETDGVVIAYTSVYGNTRSAISRLRDALREKGCRDVALHDLARCDMSLAVSDAFRYSKLVLATTTYNAEIFPFMREFIEHLRERGFRHRTVALIENGSWAPMAARVIREMLDACEGLSFARTTVRILSAPNAESGAQISALSDELCREYLAVADLPGGGIDVKALFSIGYGLYVVTSNDGERDNGLVVNTVTQVTDTPNRVAVTINKRNYSHDTILRTGKMNVNCLTVDAPFRIFERFGFSSGREIDKFEGEEILRTENGLAVLQRDVNAVISLSLWQYIDLETHGMFICDVIKAAVLSERETMTYTYYQNHVKPQPASGGKKGYVCRICGYVYEGDPLPEDFVCPLCKHGAADFLPLEAMGER